MDSSELPNGGGAKCCAGFCMKLFHQGGCPRSANYKMLACVVLLGTGLSMSAGDINKTSRSDGPGAPGLDRYFPPPPATAAPLPLSCAVEASISKWKADAYPFDMQAKALWEASISKWKDDKRLRQVVDELNNKVSFQGGAFDGKDALAVKFTHPRTLQQYLTYPLDNTENEMFGPGVDWTIFPSGTRPQTWREKSISC